jgi:hypothetical protein
MTSWAGSCCGLAAETATVCAARTEGAVVRAVIAWLSVGMIVAGCSSDKADGGAQSAPAPSATTSTSTSSTPTSTSPPVPQLVTAVAARDALLKRAELGEIIGDTDVRQLNQYTRPWASSEGVEPPDCAPRLLFNQAVAAVNYQSAIGDNNRGAAGRTAAQLITVFDNRDQPAKVVGDFARMFGYCANQEVFSTTSGDVTQHWTAGPPTSDATDPLSDATRAGGGAQRQEAPPRNCYHAAVARANTVVESLACGDGDAAAQANEIVNRITAKLPQ